MVVRVITKNPNLINRNNVAIYCRLSVDDGLDQQSQSISNQKNILSKYVLDRGWNIFDIYVDDGYSGTNFDRPGFKRLKNDIESGLIDIVVTKDLSRLGRDYIETGRLTESYFPDHNVRYIAVSDNVDTATEVDDFVPFKNIINEFYAKDISKKIRATQKYQMQSGAFKKAAYVLYGYSYDENSRRVINPDTAPTVAKIFELFSKGYSLKGICDYLEESKTYCPRAYDAIRKGKEYTTNPYRWCSATIETMLKNREYLGHYIRGKTTKRFKSKVTRAVPVENQYVFENVFDPIVTEEMFDFCQKMFHRNKRNSSLTNPYSKLVFCGVCGRPLRVQRHKSGDGIYEERLCCENTNEIGKGSILISDLNKVIINELQELKTIILAHEDEFILKADAKMDKLSHPVSSDEYETRKNRIRCRIADINKYIKALFEEYMENKIEEDSYKRLTSEYKEELRINEDELRKYDVIADAGDVRKEDIKKNYDIFIKAIKDMDSNNVLSHFILRNIVSKILISTFKNEANKGSLGKNITIYYRFCDDFIKEFIEGKVEE